MSGLVDNKVALVTGAASGIGRATASLLAREGATVILADVDLEGLATLHEALSSKGCASQYVSCDVRQYSELRHCVSDVVARHGRLDCAVNNAGVEGPLARAADILEEQWDELHDVNLKGVWQSLRAQVPVMVAQGGGTIVNVASISGVVGSKGMAAYSATKFGVNGLTKAAALDYASKNVRINAVCPGVVRTALLERVGSSRPGFIDGVIAETPLARIAEPDEIAEAVVWLCSDRSSFVTGHILVVDGGLTAK